MTALAPHVSAFFQERLALERSASINTQDSYAYAFKLLLDYANKRLKVHTLSTGAGADRCILGRRLPERSGDHALKCSQLP